MTRSKKHTSTVTEKTQQPNNCWSAQCLQIFILHENQMLLTYVHKNYKDGNTVTFQINDIKQPLHINREKSRLFSLLLCVIILGSTNYFAFLKLYAFQGCFVFFPM